MHGGPTWSWGAYFSDSEPSSVLLASAGYDGQIRIWEPETGKVVATLKGGERWVRSVAWSPNGRSLLAGSEDGTIRIWDLPPP